MAHIKIGSICCHVDLSAELSDKVQQGSADYKKESKTDGSPRHIFYIYWQNLYMICMHWQNLSSFNAFSHLDGVDSRELACHA